MIDNEQLTEQWKKGELPDNHHYYFKLPKSKEYEVGNTFCLETMRWCKDGDKIEVIEEVPSYEQWSQTYKTKFEFLEENTKLKELLKECREKLIYCTISTQDVQAKINQVLGEE